MSKLFANETINGGQLHFTESVEIKPIVRENEKLKNIKANLTESLKEKRLILKPKIAAIHAGRTRNNTIYLEDKLRGSMVGEKGPSGMYSFLYPYNKPMLKNHDTHSEPTGRVMNSQFVTTAEGAGFIMITPHITDPDTVEKLLDGRYLTVSIGATTDSAVCNICGKDIIKDGWCEHERGETYEDGTSKTVCGWIIGNLWFDECSWVNVPSDTKAKVLDTSDSEVYAEINKESYDISNGMTITDTVADQLGLTAIITESVTETPVNEAETQETTEDNSSEENKEIVIDEKEIEVEDDESQEKDTSKETTTTDEKSAEDNEEKEVIAQTDESIEDVPNESGNENYEKENASNSESLIAILNERISTLESEVEILEERLAVQRAEYLKLSDDFSNFIRETIKENIEIVDDVDIENLENLKLDELTEKYNNLISKTRQRLSSIKNYHVSNSCFGVESDKEVFDTESTSETKKSNPVEVTPIEIYKTLLGGYKPRKQKEDI